MKTKEKKVRQEMGYGFDTTQFLNYFNLDSYYNEYELYECKPSAFSERGFVKRNNDFYKSQKQENQELFKTLDEIELLNKKSKKK